MPEKDGRRYTECDIDTLGAKSRGAKRIVFAHLQEAARPPDSYWNLRHADIILKRMRELYPEVECTVPSPGVWYEL